MQSATEKYGRAVFDFAPPPGTSQKLTISKGDILCITYSKPGEGWWWGAVVKTADGQPPVRKEGYFPAKFVEIIEKPQKELRELAGYKVGDKVRIVGLERKFPKFNNQEGIITESVSFRSAARGKGSYAT